MCRVKPEGVRIRAPQGGAKHEPDFIKACPSGFTWHKKRVHFKNVYPMIHT